MATNNTGKAASDLHITFTGTGGAVFVNPNGVVVAPGGAPPPAVPSNGIVTNEVVLDWGADWIAPCATVTFAVLTPFGPLKFVSGFWTSKVNGVPDSDIGPLEPGDIDVSPLATKLVVNSEGATSRFVKARIIGDLVIGGLSGDEALSRANRLETILSASEISGISTDAIRFALGELSIRRTDPDVTRISAFLRSGGQKGAK
jgi:hypothetical protein